MTEAQYVERARVFLKHYFSLVMNHAVNSIDYDDAQQVQGIMDRLVESLSYSALVTTLPPISLDPTLAVPPEGWYDDGGDDET